MVNEIVWVASTALITGGVWGGIVFSQRLRRRILLQEELLDDARRRLDRLEHAGDRVLEMEDRLDDAERLLMRRRDETMARRPPK